MSFEEIIAQVKMYPELWLPSHEDYKHRAVVKRAWKKISSNLNISESLVKKRWKNLKDQYRKELKKKLSNQITKSYWQHYNGMSFISSEILLGTNYSKKTEPVSEETSDSDTASYDPQTSVLDLEKVNQKPKMPQKPVKSESNRVTPKPYLKSSLKEIKELIIRRNRSADDDLKQQNDPDYLFLVSLLPTLRKLSHLQKLQFRGKVNEWLIDAVTSNEFVNQCDVDDKMIIQDQIIVAMEPSNF